MHRIHRGRDRGRPGRAAIPFTGSPEHDEIRRQLREAADGAHRRHGMSRRDFLRSQMGLSAFFLAMNGVYGRFFDVAAVEAADPDAAQERAQALTGQFIFDVQTHFVQEDYPAPEGLLSLRRWASEYNTELADGFAPEDIMFENFVREVFEQSDTALAVLSNAPDDRKEAWFLGNEQAMEARRKVNERLGGRRLLAHALITPGMPGWREEFENVLEMKPDAWKGYTLGDPDGGSEHPWRLDDEDLVYPVYERMRAEGILNVCIHKGLLPTGRELADLQVAAASVEDVGPAARDWPGLNFVIYHSALQRHFPTAADVERFEKTGRIPWVTELAEIPERFGVDNVYAELGSVFASTVMAHPNLCAGMMGQLVKGLGADHVCWGTDSVWYGSPQWQIEAMRRFEIPEDVRAKHEFEPLGPADGPAKAAIFGGNSARLYGVTETRSILQSIRR